jgi:hypothetical protein
MMSTTSVSLIFTALYDMGASVIVAEYSGGGDSGAIDELYGLPEECVTRNEQGLVTEYENDSDDDKRIEIPDSMRGSLEDLIYRKILDGVEDWYNNDGGYGNVAVCTKTGSWVCDNNVYYTETSNYNHGGTLTIEE